ncbi:MAG: 50S ribosomal protein L9 [Gammaproteobacteria bacterium]|jgi:large subunit ribosomal protein L9|nr:50S ribosomal protein L9 [Gammaproteobacteria bacterium]
MDVILLEKVDNLGNIGDRVKVRSGYGRNFLLPRGKATLATPANVAVFEARRAEFEKKEADELAAARQRAASAAKLSIRLAAKAGTEGKLFGSLGTADIAEACTAAGVAIKRSEIRLPEGPIRTLGEHAIELHLHSDVNATIQITVVAEDDGGKAA